MAGKYWELEQPEEIQGRYINWKLFPKAKILQITRVRIDMAGCRRAAGEYELAFSKLISTYENQRQLSTEETIGAFGCGRVWNLPPGKVAVLDAVFKKEGVR